MRTNMNTSWLRCVITCLLSVVILTSLLSASGCVSKFTTYNDKQGLFSISYPYDWNLAISELRDVNSAEQKVIDAISSNVPVESEQQIFYAAKTPLWRPNVSIFVESVSVTEWTYDKVVEAYVNEIKQPDNVSISFKSFSQVKTTVNGREATIFDLEYTVGPRSPKGPGDIVLGPIPYSDHSLRLLVLVGKTVWIVDCTSPSPDDFSQWKGVFQKIVKSLRINK